MSVLSSCSDFGGQAVVWRPAKLAPKTLAQQNTQLARFCWLVCGRACEWARVKSGKHCHTRIDTTRDYQQRCLTASVIARPPELCSRRPSRPREDAQPPLSCVPSRFVQLCLELEEACPMMRFAN
jgi:hypothetical protein